jgi:PAS domain S-box-containing protein
MTMIQEIFNTKHDDRLVLELIEGTKAGALASNVFGSFMVAFLLYGVVPSHYLIAFLIFHYLILYIRIHISKNFKKIIYSKNGSTAKCIKSYIFAISLSSLSFSIMAFFAIVYGASDVDILFISAIIVGISAGSIGTMGSVYSVFANFMFFGIVPLIILMFYHGGRVFDILGITLIIYLVVHLASGFRLFLSHKRSINLEKKFATIYNKSSDGIAIVKNKRVLECNDIFVRMFGYGRHKEALLNASVLDVMPKKQPDGKSSYKNMIRYLKMAQEKRVSFEWLNTKKNGENFYVEVTLSPMQLNEEKVTHAIFRDIDLRKRAELEIVELNATLEERVKKEVEKNRQKDQQMLQQSKLAQMGEMISMIAHQWRQPLSAINSAAIGINLKAQLNKLDKETAVEATDKIAQYTKHLSETIDDFRTFFKSNKEKQTTTYNELIDSVLNIIEVSVTNKGIEISKDLKSTQTFETYANEVKQVLLNLIKNAEDALIEKGVENPKIVLQSYENILIVKDNAGGIAEEIIDKIFEPYFSTKSEKTGTGLGLYMSKTIIEEHCHGSLSVTNDEDGAVFKIIL